MQENHKSVSNGLYEGFVIDNTLGRDVKFTIDQSGSGNNRINVVQISYPNGTDILDDRNPVNQTLSYKFDFLEVNTWKFLCLEYHFFYIYDLFLASILSIHYYGNRTIKLCSSNY